MNPVAPAHNPMYIRAMRLLSEKLPEIPLVAAFETGFHATVADALRYYAVPYEWARAVSDQALGLPRRQPSLHRQPDRRTAAARGSAGHLVSPGRFEQSVRDPRPAECGHVDGHEPSVRTASQ
jgi:hypothetical protein